MADQAETGSVEIELLGRFQVKVGEAVVEADRFPGRRPAELVQLLALARGHSLAREQLIEALWPRLTPEAGAANLRKAAHHARQALDDPEAVVLRAGQVSLFPSRTVETDAERFEAAADAALAGRDPVACTAVASNYGGDLLPEALYEDWTQGPREQLRSQCVELLRHGGEWERLVELEPTDEPAFRELMRQAVAAGSRPAAIRWYGRLRTALRRELGVLPSTESRELYDECVAGLGGAESTFVGRDLELAKVTAILRQEPGTTSPAVAIRGPAGIGKSALCREIESIARRESYLPVSVTAREEAGPYSPLVSLAEQLIEDDPALLDSIGSRARSALAELTSLAAPAEKLMSPLTRHQAIGAFRRLLLAAGDGRAVLLIVDDTHLADEATIDVVQHLGSAGGTALVVALAYRREAAGETLTRAVARLGRARVALEMDLGPLDNRDAAALVVAGASTPRPANVLDRIVALGQGNPFLTLELAKSPAAGVPALVATARDAIAARFLDLDEATVRMLQRLAVSGDDLDPAAVVALTGTTEQEGFELLDLALGAGVLVVSGARYRFRHDLVRQALVERLPPHERLVIHRETAQRLAAADAAPQQIAHHWLAGGRPKDAGRWLLAAANEAVRLGAYADALSHLHPFLEADGGHREGLRLRAEALDAIGDIRAPAAYAAAAIAAGDPEAQDLKAKQALATIKLGDAPGALEVLEGLEPTTVEGKLAQALAYSGAAALGFTTPELGTAKSAEARKLALLSGDPAATAVASWAQAAAAHARGDLRSNVLFDLHETQALPRLAISAFDGQLCITQRLLYGVRPYPEVIAFADSLEAEAERLGAARGRAFAVTIRGEAKLLAGDLDAADLDLARGAELHHEIGAATGEAFSLQRRAESAFQRGLRAEAGALLDEALAIARESDVGFHLMDRIYGSRIAMAPDAAAGLAALEEAEAAVRGPVETCPGCRITLAVPAAIAAARAGDVERMAEWGPIAEYLVTVVMRLPAWDAALEEVRGHYARQRGDTGAAHDHFRAAAAGFASSGQPRDEARCVSFLTEIRA